MTIILTEIGDFFLSKIIAKCLFCAESSLHLSLSSAALEQLNPL
jgi:hypothetical protein